MADEQGFGAYTNQAHLKTTDVLIAATDDTGAAGINVLGSHVAARRSDGGPIMVGGALFNQTASGTPYYFFGNADGPPNGKYSYIGGGSGGYITFGKASDDLATLTEHARFDASGNLGIGTASPTSKLEVAGNITTSWPAIAGVVNFIGSQYSDGSSYKLGMILDHDNRTVTLAAKSADGTGGIKFQTGDTPTDRMLISWAGDVGIGTSSPLAATGYRSLSLDTPSGLGSIIDLRQGGTVRLRLVATTASAAIETTGSIPISFSPGGTERMRLDASGNLTIGTAVDLFGSRVGLASNGNVATINYTGNANNVALVIRHNQASGATSGQQISFQNGANLQAGGVFSTGSATSFVTSSDYRLKDITGPVENSGAFIDALNPVVGSWKVDGQPFVGLIAHEVQDVATTPLAFGEKDGERMQALDYSSPELIANMIAEMQAMRARLAALEGAA